jgi:hypothetical protein
MKMKWNTLKKVALLLASVAPLGAAKASLTSGPNEHLVLFEDLGPEWRLSARDTIELYLAVHPEVDPKAVYFAFDSAGRLHVLDRNSTPAQMIAQPSCHGNDTL